jgi:hypothetical protein
MPRYSPIWICICAVFFFVLLLFPCSLLIIRVSESPCFIFVLSFYLYFCFSCFDRTYVCSIFWLKRFFFVYVCFDSALFIVRCYLVRSLVRLFLQEPSYFVFQSSFHPRFLSAHHVCRLDFPLGKLFAAIMRVWYLWGSIYT